MYKFNYFKQLKMRAGGVDPSRMGRKKRSPKPRPKRPKPAQDGNVAPSESHTSVSDQVTASDGQPTQNIEEGGPDGSQPEGVAYVNAPRERLATTPASPGEDGVIDICKKFQVSIKGIFKNAVWWV